MLRAVYFWTSENRGRERTDALVEGFRL